MAEVKNRTNLSETDFESISNDLKQHQSLQDLLRWAERQPEGTLIPGAISDLVIQGEFNHDLVALAKRFHCLRNYMTGSNHSSCCVGSSSNCRLLEARLNEGWKPTPSLLKDGNKVLGHAACLFSEK